VIPPEANALRILPPTAVTGDDLFFAESTLAHDSSSDPGRVILNGESHISHGLVSGGQVTPDYRKVCED
jgi:hypothetical protein